MKFSGKVGNRPVNKWLNFGGDTDPDTCLYRDTGKTCLGGGMHCPSASSFSLFLKAHIPAGWKMTRQSAMMLIGCGVKVGMAHSIMWINVWVAGQTV